MIDLSRRIAQTGLLLLVILTVTTGSVVGYVGTGAPVANVSQSDYVAASDNVDVWEGAALPFRADTSNAAETIDNTNLFVNVQDQGSGDVPVNKDKLAVYSADSTVNFNLQSGVTGAGTTGFHGTETELLVAKLNEDQSLLSEDFTGLTPAEAFDLVTSENANSNASFTIQNAGTISNGELSTSYDLSNSSKPDAVTGSGQYVFMLVEKGDFSVDGSNNLSVTSQAKVIGMDAVMAQSASATANPSSDTVTRGNSVTINTDSGISGAENHTLVVYHESTFKNAETTVNVPNLSRDVTGDDVTIDHDISTLNGPVENVNKVTIAGATFGAGSSTGPTSVASAIDYIVDRAGTEEPEQNAGTTELDGAVYTISGDSSFSSKTIQTQSDWSTGTYRVLYVAGGSDSTTFATEVDSFTLKKKSTGGNNGGNGGGGGGGDDDDDDDDDGSSGGGGGGVVSPPPTEKVEITKNVDPQSGVVKITINNPGINKEIEVDVGNKGRFDSAITSLGLTFSKDIENVNMNVNGLDKRPDNIPADPTKNTLKYVEVTLDGVEDGDVSSARFRFSVKPSQIKKLGAEPDDVVLYRYHDGEWQELETNYLGLGKFEAESPGFSVFAVGVKDAQQQTTTTTTDEPTTTTDEPTTTKEPKNTNKKTTTSSTGIPGFGLSVTLVALLAIALIAIRRD